MLKEIIISIVENSIHTIRMAANSEDIYLISSELEHLISLLDILKNKYELRDYFENFQKKYIEKTSGKYENSYEYLWKELEEKRNVPDDYKFVFDKIEDIILNIIIIGVDNIVRYTDNIDYKNIYIEVYHIHNLPCIILSNEKTELIKYYQDIERKQYSKECRKEAKKRFKGIWKELNKITKSKKK